MKSPKLVNIQNSWKTPFVVVNSNQFVFIEYKKTQTRLFEHAVLFFFAFGSFQMSWNIYVSNIAARFDVKKCKFFGVSCGQEGSIGINTYGFISRHSILNYI